MASVQTSSYQGRYLKLDVTEESYSIANNNSVVRWTVSSVGGSDNYYTMYGCKAVVNGETKWNPGTVSWSAKTFPAKTGSTTGTITVGHDSAGKASISFSLTGAVYKNSPQTYSGSLTLTNIPRYTSITEFNISASTETAIVFSWRTSDVVDYVWYSIDNGQSYRGVDCADGTTGSYTWTGLAAGTTYPTKVCVRRKDSQLQTYWDGYKNVTTYSNPYVTSWPGDFTMDAATKSMSIGLYNPLERTVSYSFTFGGYTWSGSTTHKTAASISFDTAKGYAQMKTAQSKNISFSACGSSATKTVYGSATYAGPSVNKDKFVYTIQHNKSCLSGLTKMVQGYSYFKIRYSDTGIYTLNQSADLKSITFTFGGTTQNITASDVNFNNGSTYNYTTSTSGTITVTDSRGYTASASVSIPFLAYNLPTGSISAKRDDGYSAPVTILGSGSCTSLDGKNTYTIKWKAGSSGATQDFTNGKATTSLDSSSSQTYYLLVTDSLGNTNSWNKSATVGIGQPILLIDKKTTAVGVNKIPTEKGLAVDGNITTTGNLTVDGHIYGTNYNSGKFVVSKQANKSALADVVNELKMTNGQIGSVSLAEYKTGSLTIPAKWYNYIWIPHRDGGNNGAASGDNCAYGTLLLHRMTESGPSYRVTVSNNSIVHAAAEGLEAYPVNAIYLSWGSTSPASLFGGTWTQITDRFLYCHNSAGSTGGDNSNSHTHSLSSHTHTTAIGSHNHDSGTYYSCFNHHDGYFWFYEISGRGSYPTSGRASASGNTGNWSQSEGVEVWGYSGNTDVGSKTSGGPSNNTSGGASNTNNMPAYVTCYAWRRTA